MASKELAAQIFMSISQSAGMDFRTIHDKASGEANGHQEPAWSADKRSLTYLQSIRSQVETHAIAAMHIADAVENGFDKADVARHHFVDYRTNDIHNFIALLRYLNKKHFSDASFIVTSHIQHMRGATAPNGAKIDTVVGFRSWFESLSPENRLPETIGVNDPDRRSAISAALSGALKQFGPLPSGS